MSPALDVLPAGEWGAAVGSLLVRRAAARPGLRLCLPTGETPIPAYAAFAAAGGRLDDAEVFLLDEFDLPDGHPSRCDEMLQRDLLDLLDAPPGALHRLDVAAEDLDRECARFCALIAAGGLDLTLLGIGTNGHLGLNEPGSAIDSTCRVVDLHPDTARRAGDYGDGAAPRRGATIGIAEILASREVWLLATGRRKAEILRAALRGPVSPEVPASYLQTHPNTMVFADTEAASLLL